MVEFVGTEPLAIICRHQRLAERFEGPQFGFLKEVEAAVRRFELHGEIVFIANDSLWAITGACRQHRGPVACRDVPRGLDDLVANRLGRHARSIRRKLGPKESAFARNRVATGAFSLAEEYFLAACRIAGGCPCFNLALQNS